MSPVSQATRVISVNWQLHALAEWLLFPDTDIIHMYIPIERGQFMHPVARKAILSRRVTVRSSDEGAGSTRNER